MTTTTAVRQQDLPTHETDNAPGQLAVEHHERRRRTIALGLLVSAQFVVDEATARDFLQRYADGLARDERRIYGLYADDELVGGTLFRVFSTTSSMCEVGVWLSAEARGRGLVTEAVRAMIDWAMDVRGINRVEWHCSTTNTASSAVARRLGMRLEGVHREAFPHRGRADDVEVWALLASDRQAS